MRISDWSSDVCSSDLIQADDGGASNNLSLVAIASISVTAADAQPPVLAANQMTIDEGGTAVLSAAELAATDPDSDEGGLLFTVGGVTGGQFELVANPGIAITSFTQAEVTAGEVRFVHDEIGRAHVGTPVTNAHLVCR